MGRARSWHEKEEKNENLSSRKNTPVPKIYAIQDIEYYLIRENLEFDNNKLYSTFDLQFFQQAHLEGKKKVCFQSSSATSLGNQKLI